MCWNIHKREASCKNLCLTSSWFSINNFRKTIALYFPQSKSSPSEVHGCVSFWALKFIEDSRCKVCLDAANPYKQKHFFQKRKGKTRSQVTVQAGDFQEVFLSSSARMEQDFTLNNYNRSFVVMKISENYCEWMKCIRGSGSHIQPAFKQASCNSGLTWVLKNKQMFCHFLNRALKPLRSLLAKQIISESKEESTIQIFVCFFHFITAC